MKPVFIGFALVELIRAYTDNEENSFTYDIVYSDKMGRRQELTVKTNVLDRDYTKLRMKGDRFAILVGTSWKTIDEDQYRLELQKWDEIRERRVA